MDSTVDQLRAQFQAELDALHDGETLQLTTPRERPGPVVIRKSIVLDGQGVTIWSMQSPVLTVAAPRVVVRNLRVEFTGEQEGSADQHCAVSIYQGNAVFENTEVRGAVLGLKEEEGEWRYPISLMLGRLAHGMEHSCLLRVVAPVPCRLTSDISGLEVEPRNLTTGAHEVRLHIERMTQDTLLCGTLTLSTAFLKRRIMLSAHILSTRDGEAPAATEQDRIVWQPEDWEALRSGQSSAAPAVSVRIPPPLPTAPMAAGPVSMPVTAPPAQPSVPAPAAVRPQPAPPVSPPPQAAPPRATPARVPPVAPPPPPVLPPPAATPPAAAPAAQAPSPAPPIVTRSSGMRRVQGSPLGALFSPPTSGKAPADPSSATPAAPEKKPASVPLNPLFSGGAGSATPDAPAAQDSTEPFDPTPSPPPIKSVRLKPLSSVFGTPPAPTPQTPGAPTTPAKEEKTPPAADASEAAVQAEPPRKKSRSVNLPSIFSPRTSPPPEKKDP